MNTLFKNITVISPEDNLNGVFDIVIKDGIISFIGSFEFDKSDFDYVIDGANMTAVPGFFDMHVHFRDPGQTEKEDIDSGIASAANGGFTGVLCMPNTNPPIDSREVISYIQNKAKGNVVDVYISACASKNREGNKLADLNDLYEAGALAFTDDGSPLLNQSVLADTLNFGALHSIPFLQHAENYKISGNGVIHKGIISENLNVEGIPYESETETVKNDVKLTDSIKGAKYHIQHLSCGDTVDIIRNARKHNKLITCEACPHHFVLTHEMIIKEGTNAKMNPPLREINDVRKILEGIQDDTIDVICTDHAPHTIAEKSKDIYQAPFGIIGLETCIGLSYTYLVNQKIISFENMIKKLSDNPRRILNLPRISIKEGEKANLTILDLSAKWKVDSKKFKTKSRNTPFNGFELLCKPVGIFNNNKLIFSDL